MEIPAQVTSAFWGAVGGAAAVAFIGFNFAGWLTAGTAETLASQRASKAVVSALAPICADNFKRAKDASAQLVELKKAESWKQGEFVSKGGWAAIPGVAAVDSAMATSCAEMIIGSKS
ncbi:MAG: hypothetical protein ABL904_02780 [Hyphomicrobiaceae bacterium]